MDANLSDVAPIIDSINQVKTGGLILIVLAMCAGLVGYRLWLKRKKQEAAEAARLLEIEQKGKDARAHLYTKTWESVTRGLSKLEASMERHNNDSSTNARALQSTLSDLSQTIRDGNTTQLAALQTILNNVRGVMTTEDSLRLVEATFENFLSPEFERVASLSILKNDYSSRKDFVRVSVMSRLSSLVAKAQKSLESYTMAIRPELFFPLDKSTNEYELVINCWIHIQEVHENKKHHGDGSTSGSYAEHVSLQVSREVRQAFVDGHNRAIDIYHQPEVKRYPSSADIR